MAAGEALLPHSASVMSSTRRTETPARYISMRASSTRLSRRRYRSLMAVSKDTLELRHMERDVAGGGEVAVIIQLYNFLRHGLQTPFRVMCGNFILPELCKLCLFLLSLFAQVILPYPEPRCKWLILRIVSPEKLKNHALSVEKSSNGLLG